MEKIRIEYVLDCPVHNKITGFDVCAGSNTEDDQKEHRRKAVDENHLVISIMTMISRVYSIAVDDVPNFEDYKI